MGSSWVDRWTTRAKTGHIGPVRQITTFACFALQDDNVDEPQSDHPQRSVGCALGRGLLANVLHPQNRFIWNEKGFPRPAQRKQHKKRSAALDAHTQSELLHCSLQTATTPLRSRFHIQTICVLHSRVHGIQRGPREWDRFSYRHCAIEIQVRAACFQTSRCVREMVAVAIAHESPCRDDADAQRHCRV